MPDLIINNVTYLDLASGEAVPGSGVRIADRRIVEVAKGRRISGSAPELDGEARTLMPGLIDAHTHAAITTLDMATLTHRRATRIGVEAKQNLEAMLRRGFTTVRDAGGLDRGIAEALEARQIIGPRVFRSGRFISQTGGHGDFEQPHPNPHLCACHIASNWLSHVADGADAVRRAVREELKDGADQIKVMASGGVSSPTDSVEMTQYTKEELRAAVVEAASRGTYVLTHAFVPESIIRAVRAGVRSIEHGNLLDAATAREMKEHDAFLVPTLVTFEQLALVGEQWKYPAESIEKLRHVLDEGARAVQFALDADVKVGFGSDLMGEAHPAQGRELLLRARIQTPLDVLRSATLINAELLNREGELGVVEVGALADLLLVDGDPLSDLSLLADPNRDAIDLIMRDGEVVHSAIH